MTFEVKTLNVKDIKQSRKSSRTYAVHSPGETNNKIFRSRTIHKVYRTEFDCYGWWNVHLGRFQLAPWTWISYHRIEGVGTGKVQRKENFKIYEVTYGLAEHLYLWVEETAFLSQVYVEEWLIRANEGDVLFWLDLATSPYTKATIETCRTKKTNSECG